MPIIIEKEEDVKAAVYGGAFLGGGGGGSIEEGLNLALKALEIDKIRIYDVNELSDDTIVITVSAVGAPAAKESYLKPEHLVRAVELINSFGVNVGALMPAENGGFNTVNGWYQSVKLKIPLLNAACDGRAHPTGLMGAIGLHRVKDYISIQAAAGGNPEKNQYVEVIVRGSLTKAASMIRRASVEAGGVVGVARNPVKISYVRKNAAIKAITFAIDVGRKLLRGIENDDIYGGCEDIVKMLNGEIVDKVKITSRVLETKEGFDIGYLNLSGQKGDYSITFVNEYLALEKNGSRIATFPDLISLVDLSSGKPISSAEADIGIEALLVVIPRTSIPLGAGLFYHEVYEPIEKAVGKPIVDFIKDILKG